jgi:hypothetical protein
MIVRTDPRWKKSAAPNGSVGVGRLTSSADSKSKLQCQIGPQRNWSVAFAQLQVIHDQAGLIGSVHIELCFRAGNDNLDRGPSLFFYINV